MNTEYTTEVYTQTGEKKEYLNVHESYQELGVVKQINYFAE